MSRLSAPRRSFWVSVLAGIALVTGALIFAYFYRRARAAPPPLEVAMWYWHTPFKLPTQESADLRAMGIRQLFVRAATITRRTNDGSLAVVLPQTWTHAPVDAPVIHLVFRVDDAVSRRLSDLPIDTLAGAITDAIQQQRAQATQAGLRVVGVQIDLDCPTRLLPRYAALLQVLRPALAAMNTQPALKLSITALSSWYASKEIGTVLDAVDFAVPQFYEGTTARTRKEFRPLLEEASLKRGLQRAGRSGHPFYAGLPAYGHALVYDRNGNLRGAFHDASAPDVLRHPDFRLKNTFASDAEGKPAQDTTKAIGEEILEFTGANEDFRLLFDLPTPRLVKRALDRLHTSRPANCQGVILFRYPEPGETDTLPLSSIAATLHGQTATAPTLQLRFRTRRHAPWSLIEAGESSAQEEGTDLFVDVTASGPFGTRVAPDAAVVTLRFDRPGYISALSAGGFDMIVPLAGNARSSLPRADGLSLHMGYQAPGQTVTAGPIRLSGNATTTVHASWRTTTPGEDTIDQGAITTPIPLENRRATR